MGQTRLALVCRACVHASVHWVNTDAQSDMQRVGEVNGQHIGARSTHWCTAGNISNNVSAVFAQWKSINEHTRGLW